MTMAAALAYYTIFSLPPILIIITNLASIFLDGETVKVELQNTIGGMVGDNGANQLLSTIENIGVFKQSIWTTTISVVVLLFTATTVFGTIKNSLNLIFRVKSSPKNTIVKQVRDRLLSLAMILVVGFIMLVSLILDAFVNIFHDYLSTILPGIQSVTAEITSVLIPLLIVMVLFALIFKVLPDIKMNWKDSFVGAFFTALLFTIGKYLIGFYVSNSDIATIYDAAGSVLILMVWIFYSSVIFYYGAQITYTYANIFGSTVRPSKRAVRITFREAEGDEYF